LAAPRVVVTGMGALTPIGNDVETFWRSLTAGSSGVGQLTRFHIPDFPVRIAAEVKGFDATEHLERKLARHTGRAAQLALVAARQALTDAALTVEEDNAPRVGVVLNSGFADAGNLEMGFRALSRKGPRSISPFLIPMVLPNNLSCLVSMDIGARGPVVTSMAACASGNYALVEAYHIMQRGEADVVLAGASEALPGLALLAAFERMGALSHHDGSPQGASRPFDAERDGFVCGEGAAVLVLETEDHARKRRARIYAEVLGGCLRADAYHITAPDPEGTGAARAMRDALLAAGVTPKDADAVFAHGTSTRLNDAVETKAIKSVFGEHAYRLAISATKSMLGHTLGAAGAISAVAAVLALQRGVVPPTINYCTPDPDCDLDYVPNVARRQSLQLVMVNALGFGGQNVAVVLKAYENSGHSIEPHAQGSASDCDSQGSPVYVAH